MNIAMVSVHTNPVATETSSHEGLRVHIVELAQELGRQGHRVTIYTRRDGLGSGEQVRLAPEVNVEFISAGNALPMSEQEVLPHIKEFADRLAKRLGERRLTLEVTPDALEWLADEGNDPAYGARPLRRLVQTAIGDRLAKALLNGDIHDGDTVLVDLSDTKESLTVVPAVHPLPPGRKRKKTEQRL